MYYIGVNSNENFYSFFITLMHRKTAKRVYEPVLFETYDGLNKDELEKKILAFYESKEFTILKKKFSQSGRPPRKVLTPPYFIICGDDNLEEIVKNLRVSYTRIVFDEDKKIKNHIYANRSILIESLFSIIKEKRVNLDKLIQMTKDEEKLKSEAEIDRFKEAFEIVAYYNEVGNKSIKRY